MAGMFSPHEMIRSVSSAFGRLAESPDFEAHQVKLVTLSLPRRMQSTVTHWAGRVCGRR